MDLRGLEPGTDRLWAGCSNQLSYRSISLKPMNGLEPLTCWLQISCSANWATSACCSLIACRSKTEFSRSRCNRLYDDNINYTSMQAFVLMMLPSCTQSLFRVNWATSAYSFFLQPFCFLSRTKSFLPLNSFSLRDSYGNRTRVTAVKGRCLNRLTKEPFPFVPYSTKKLPE